LTTQQETQFLSTLIRDVGLSVDESSSDESKACEMALIHMVEMSQAYVRSQRLWRVHVSIRDMMRVLQLYRVLLTGDHRGVFLLPLPPGVLPGSTAGIQHIHWCAAIVAVALAYQLRLPAALRVDWAKRLDALLVEHRCPAHLRSNAVVQKTLDRFYASTHVPPGIAPTSALKENIYATVLCLVARVPLNITGPPGCGKTLAVQTVIENMKGASSIMPMYKLLPNLQQSEC
jgi:hypothetical protein